MISDSLRICFYFLCRVKNELNIRKALPADCLRVTELIRELAVFEKAENEHLVTAEELKDHAFGERKFVEIIVADVHGEVTGAALFFEKYSTWKGPAIHLEDLIVAESHRGKGIGAALLDEVIRIGKSRNYRRVYWQVLDWNTDAIRFYERYKAKFEAEWLNVYVELQSK